MEAALTDAIIQLQQVATPPPPRTSATKIPIFQTNDERIHSILHAFVNKTLNKQAEEREETPKTSGLTNQQEQMYATEWQTKNHLLFLTLFSISSISSISALFLQHFMENLYFSQQRILGHPNRDPAL